MVQKLVLGLAVKILAFRVGVPGPASSSAPASCCAGLAGRQVAGADELLPPTLGASIQFRLLALVTGKSRGFCFL